MLGRKTSPEKEIPVVRYSECPAKTYIDPMGNTTIGRSVLNHCQIVGEVAREIIARTPVYLRDLLFPEGSIMAAASHDIGKVSPCFVEKIRQVCTPSLETIKPLPNINPKLESQWGGHAGVSQVTAKALNAPDYIPEILGQHHGFAPSVAGKRADDESFGGPAWRVSPACAFGGVKKCR